MKLSREVTVGLNRILNDYIPPIIRDQRWFGQFLTWLLFKDNAPIYMSFNERIYEMSDEEMCAVYSKIHAGRVEWDVCLTKTCIDAILKTIVGTDVLEVGCGKGYLSGLLAREHKVTACDAAVIADVKEKYPAITFVDAMAEKLPFPDNSFDTVISTHTLEHVRDIQKAIQELRRVCKKRLIVVLPWERAHLYTPNLHLHFFPYRHSFLLTFRPVTNYALEKISGEWFYWEDRS